MSVTEETRKSNIKIMTIYISIVCGLLIAYVLGYIFYIKGEYSDTIFEAIPHMVACMGDMKLLYPINGDSLFGIFLGVVGGVVVYFFVQNDNVRNYSYKQDEVAGTGGFMSQKEMKEYSEKYIEKDPEPILDNLPITFDWKEDIDRYSRNIIMSNRFCRPINSRALIGNNNVLIVGGAGTGKSRYYIKPNVLQMNSSYVITDPSGEMIYSTGKTLKEHGYKIKIFNISDMAHSNCYNPLKYIRDEAGVNMLIECLINNTTKGEGGGDNQFFVDAEKLLYSACIFYLLDFCQDESKKNFAGVMNMINSSSVNEADPNAKSPLDMLFDKLPHNSLAWKYYKAFKQAAGKTLKSIIISCVTRLQPFMTPQVVNLTKIDNIELDKIGNEKTALFIITPQADRTYSFLASMLYSQLFETLYYIGEQQKASGKSEEMKIPVRCLMDEFANIGEVPEFPSKLATMRKYNISASIVLQDIAQIEAMYADNWKTLVGNCSTIIFLGTQEPNTLKYFSEMLGKMTIQTKSRGMSHGTKNGSNKNFQSTGREVMTPDELGRMPSDECIVFTQNMRPVRDKKYIYQNHPYYSQTADADEINGFQYNKLSIYDNTKQGNIESILVAQGEAKRFKAMSGSMSEEAAKLKSTDGVVVSGNLNDEMNKFTPEKKIEERAYNLCLQDCQIKAANNYDDTACIFKINDIPTKYLYKLVDQVSASLQKTPMLIFSDITINNKNNYIVGIGIDKEKIGLEKAMNNTYSQGLSVNGKYIITAISKHIFEEYKEIVLENLNAA